ncbi:DNA replication complex GINS family protein [Candidatus Woesearchaeota archaeon]|nr:DNA replication complex GINS family protein [Candidatus Woesearchaeota archaeon]
MLTFDAIRNIERAEKENKKLQKIPDDFFIQVKEYLAQKEAMKDKSSLDVLEVQNVKNTIKRLIELRERKIIESAILSSRTGLPAENLTKADSDLFDAVLNSLRKFRGEIEEKKQEKGGEVVYRVKKSLPDFVGPDMKIYSLRENDILPLPKELAELLSKDDVVEEIR